MPSNKKPRKAYKPKPVGIPSTVYTRKVIDRIKGIITEITLVVELTLPRGAATDEHMHRIQDLLNWGGMMLFDRKFPDRQAYREFIAEHYQALHAYSRIYKRKNEKKTTGYVATAEELNILRSVCGTLCELLKEAVEIAPHRTVREFLASKQIVEETHERNEKLGILHGVQELSGMETKRVLNQRHYIKR